MYLFGNKLCEHVILHSIYDYCKIALILYIVGIACHVISYTVTNSYKIGHTVRTKHFIVQLIKTNYKILRLLK